MIHETHGYVKQKLFHNDKKSCRLQKSMIIGVDAGALAIQDKRLQVGVYQVTVNLLQQLARIDKKNNYLLYTFQPIEENLLISFGQRMQNIVIRPQKAWNKLWLPLRVLQDKPDIFLALNQMPLNFKPQKTKLIGLFHDLSFEYFPDMYLKSLARLKKGSKKLAEQSSRIIAVSHSTKKDIQKFYTISPNKIVVAYEGARTFPKAKINKKHIPYFLFVGALKRQKNIPGLMGAFSQINTPTQLIIAGGDKWFDPEITKVIHNLPILVKERIVFKQFVGDNELASLYANALAFVSPSFYEGFGLPFVEAMSLGCPVIGSKTGSLPEIVGKAGILVDPNNRRELAKAMEKILKDRKYREKFVTLGKEKARGFSWESFAKTIFSIIGE